MRAKLLVLAVAVLTVATLGTYQGHAQEEPFDPGETSLLKIACDTLTSVAKGEGVTVRACRRAAPETVDGYRATAKIALHTDLLGKVVLDVDLYRSPWWVQYWSASSG